jgi:uncharacterized protein (DUF2235 family)
MTSNASRDRPGKRLILCLDGTWNKRSSNTNVFHLHNLVAERGSDDVPQLRYYDEGVGTGIFDYATGGAFGFGLDENVIGAYEWLVENYLDGDEIYLFGFSRGAFTVRSLVGLLMKCGLLRAGAPLTVDQLWQGYRILGRYREPDTGIARPPNWWETIFGRERLEFRSLIELMWDTGKQRVPDLNGTEALLCGWSRRVPVHCVGVFDTVGAMGLDALAIPGLRTRIAAFHNTNPSRLMKHGLHALSIDEHRRSFRHVPWQSFTPANGPAPRPWDNIEQRWFVGAHANIGGGYEDNPLCLFPLAWMVERLTAMGVGFRSAIMRPSVTDCLPLRTRKGGSQSPLRDSYAEFLSGWGRLFGSRYYRCINPDPIAAPGYQVASINETIDPSVTEFVAGDENYRPSNYLDYLRRTKPEENVSE